MICQSYLTFRFWTLSKNIAFTVLLCLPIVGAVSDPITPSQSHSYELVFQYISVIYATIALVVYTSLADRVRVTAIGTAWLSLEAASDTLIAIALIIQLGHYTRKTNFAETQSLLRKLMFNAA